MHDDTSLFGGKSCCTTVPTQLLFLPMTYTVVLRFDFWDLFGTRPTLKQKITEPHTSNTSNSRSCFAPVQ
jgi:hypothetical protein